MIRLLRPKEHIDEADVQSGLQAVREEGEVEEKVVLSQLYGEVRKAVRHVSNVAGLRQQYYFPFAKLEDVAQQPASAHTDEGADET